MLLLGIDTATQQESVAVVDNHAVLAEKSIVPRGNHSTFLLNVISEVLLCSRVSLRDLDGIAVSIGPGSYTGLRVGVSTAKGLAYSAQKAIVGVSTLEALAEVLVDDAAAGGLVCPMLNARKGEVFASLFEIKDGTSKRFLPDVLVSPEVILGEIKRQQKECLFLGDGAELYDGMIRERLGDRATSLGARPLSFLGREVARLGEEKIAKGICDELPVLSPVYIKTSSVGPDLVPVPGKHPPTGHPPQASHSVVRS